MKRTLLACSICALAALTSRATTVIVTPGDPSWYATNVQGGGSVAITSTNPRSGNGSLEFSTSGSTGKADYEHDFAGGTLSSIANLSYDAYRDSASTTNAILDPAFRLLFCQTGTITCGQLVYEPYYTYGGSIATNTWTTFNMNQTTGIFWLKYFGSPVVEEYNHTLSSWESDSRVGNATVYGIQVGVGSGWEGTSHMFADNVTYNTTDYNFEVSAAATPEPSTFAFLALGLAAVVTARRKLKA